MAKTKAKEPLEPYWRARLAFRETEERMTWAILAVVSVARMIAEDESVNSGYRSALQEKLRSFDEVWGQDSD
jgi:hypothetical protein